MSQLVSNYDGIYLTKKAAYQLRYTNPRIGNLDSWDVESICIFNPAVIVPISENDFDKAKINDYTKQNTSWDEYFGRDSSFDLRKKDKQMQHDFNLYGNKNVGDDMSKPFNGKHPGIIAQGDGRTRDTQRARKFNGTIKSALKENDITLYHGTRADFNNFDLAYLSSG